MRSLNFRSQIFLLSLSFSLLGQASVAAPAARKGAVQATRGPEIKFLASNANSIEPIETLLTGEPTHFAPPFSNFKLSIVFDRAMSIARVHVESCEKEWSDGLQVFTSPGLGRFFTEGGKASLDTAINASKVESIAIVFGHEQLLCLKNLKFFDDKQKPIQIAVTSSVRAKTSSGEVLFDSHPETVTALEDPITITFDEPQKFDRAIIWTGGSPLHAQSLKLTGEKGWAETLPMRASPSDQEVIFRKPFSGKSITVSAPDAGEIGEIRFGNATKVQAVKPPAGTDEISKKFLEAGFERTLETSMKSTEEQKWIFLFRRDGTFFIRGFNDDPKQAHDYSSVGAFTIVRTDKNKVRVKVNGVRFATSLAWDGVSCPFSCGNEGSNEGATSVTDTLVFDKTEDGGLMIRNRTPHTQRTLTFGDLKVIRAGDE